jgi:hypothetical protein
MVGTNMIVYSLMNHSLTCPLALVNMSLVSAPEKPSQFTIANFQK